MSEPLYKRYSNLRIKYSKQKYPSEKTISQRRFAKDLGITYPNVCRLESGLKELTLTELKAYHDAFKDVSYDYLLGTSDFQTIQEMYELKNQDKNDVEEEVEPIAINIYRELTKCIKEIRKIQGYGRGSPEFVIEMSVCISRMINCFNDIAIGIINGKEDISTFDDVVFEYLKNIKNVTQEDVIIKELTKICLRK